jgi:uncharacterized membrane protein YccC
MLIVPVDTSGTNGRIALLVIAAGVISTLATAIISYASVRMSLIGMSAAAHVKPARPAAPGKLPVPFRMALQMFAALTLAFAIGMAAFPSHWPWVVLSAFIVCSGAIGRGDALYKALLRLGGAIGGTLLAALLSRVTIADPGIYAAVVFLVLFVGLWLRQINYAFWAACATLIFALLQNAHGQTALALFAARIQCIFIGAFCGVAATWFVYPIRTEHVVRRRIADALAAMRGVLAGETHDLSYHGSQIERVAAPVRLHRAVFSKRSDEHPAAWIDATHALLAFMRTPGFDRKQAAEELRRLRSLLSETKGSKG